MNLEFLRFIFKMYSVCFNFIPLFLVCVASFLSILNYILISVKFPAMRWLFSILGKVGPQSTQTIDKNVATTGPCEGSDYQGFLRIMVRDVFRDLLIVYLLCKNFQVPCTIPSS